MGFPGAVTALAAVVFVGNYDEVFSFLEEQQWTDGLPVVPPTIAAVEHMLGTFPLAHDTAVGVVPPFDVTATVWNTAVNGVMAGCRPDDLPLLVALVKALVDEQFRLEDAGSTTGWGTSRGPEWR